MREDREKAEETEQEAKSSELSEEDLEKVAGGLRKAGGDPIDC